MRALRDRGRRRRRRDRHVRHRRRPRRHGQRVDDGRARRRRRRRARREARQPGRVVAVRLGRRARGARRRDRARARRASRAASTTAGVGFCFAPRYHPAMRFLGPARRELGVPTTFNFLGPLANPARVRRQAVGVSRSDDGASDARRAARARRRARAGVPRRRRPRRAHHHRRRAPCTSCVDGEVRTYTVDPADLGIARADGRATCAAATPPRNAACVEAVLAGEQGPLPRHRAAERGGGARGRGRRRRPRRRCRSRGRAAIDCGRAPASARRAGARQSRGARRRERQHLMAPVLQCPDCGTKHPLDVASDAAAFRCSGCGRTLKVPAQFRAAPVEAAPFRSRGPDHRGAGVAAPPNARPRCPSSGRIRAVGERQRGSSRRKVRAQAGRRPVLDASARLARRGAARLRHRVRRGPSDSASSPRRSSRTSSSRPGGTASGRWRACCRSSRSSPPSIVHFAILFGSRWRVRHAMAPVATAARRSPGRAPLSASLRRGGSSARPDRASA